MSKVPKKLKRNLLVDFLMVLCSVALAVLIIRSGALVAFFTATNSSVYVASFVAGFFFTSVFTVAPATAVFAGIIQGGSPLFPVVMIGAFGALLGDLVLFHFVRDRLAGDIMALFKYKRPGRVKAFYHSSFFHWVMPALGALIIASPLPDELGLALLGVARLGTSVFIPISYTFNALGIVLVALVSGVL